MAQQTNVSPRRKPRAAAPRSEASHDAGLRGRASEDQYRTIFERYPHPAWVLDRATLGILASNEAATARYGYTHREFLALPYTQLHVPEDGASVRAQLGEVAAAALWKHRTKSGRLIRVHTYWGPVPFNRIPAILMVAEPTKKTLNRLLQETEEGRARFFSLSRRLVEIQEKDRAKIARELHDEIGQLLTGLKLIILSKSRHPENGGRGMAPEEAEMVNIVNELIGRLRDLSMDLRPPMLEEMGLLPTLLWHFDRYTARTRIQVSFSHSIEGVRFAPDVEIAGFRIVQEALTNVARHAGVGTVEVEVRADPFSLILRIEDRGEGFDSRMVPTKHSAGIIGMQERALVLGGQLIVESAPGSGTRITAEIPTVPGRERGHRNKNEESMK